MNIYRSIIAQIPLALQNGAVELAIPRTPTLEEYSEDKFCKPRNDRFVMAIPRLDPFTISLSGSLDEYVFHALRDSIHARLTMAGFRNVIVDINKTEF